MAALTGTLAGTRQGMISFTQGKTNRKRTASAFRCCNAAGFDPQAMPTFLEKLLDQGRVTLRDHRKFC